ncbi:MAG: signal peptidase I [Solirubrobacterales bacterium]|nr:signal peptidase I [Solirubrobacterales bacterium]
MASREATTSEGGGFLELVGILIVAIGLALLIQAFLVKPYKIPSESMVPTLEVGQRVVANRIGDRFTDPEIGEIIIFHPPATVDDDGPSGKGGSGICGVGGSEEAPCARPFPEASKQNFVKRVVAGPGDRIAVEDDHVVLNGKRQKEPFIETECGGGPANFPKPITVPAGHWFMMGDNRECSEDSRFWGPVPRDWIIGGAFVTYWPPKRIGLL